MKKSIQSFVAVVATALVLVSCGGATSGPAEKVLDKKTYAQVVNKYEDVGYFVDGICIVKVGWNQYGAINKKGEEVIPADVYKLGHVKEGMIIAENSDHKYGVYNTKGELVIPFRYDEIEDYCSGLARVKTGGYSNTKYGYVDKSGNEVVTVKYDRASSSFSEGLAYIATKDGWNYKYGFINPKGEEIVPLMYKDAEDFHEGMAAVETKNGWGYINIKGELVTAANYDAAGDFSEGLAVVEKKGKYLVINDKGEEQYQFQKGLTPAGSYHEGLLLVCNEKTSKYGYLDKKGEIALPLEYPAADGFRGGKALTAKPRKGECVFEFIDAKGKVVGTIERDDYVWDYDDVEDAFCLAVEEVVDIAEDSISSSSSDDDDSSDTESGDWDELIGEYEKYVNNYISLYKKALSGDMSALSSYSKMLESAESLSERLKQAEDDMSESQIDRYLKITEKMISAALDGDDD